VDLLSAENGPRPPRGSREEAVEFTASLDFQCPPESAIAGYHQNRVLHFGAPLYTPTSKEGVMAQTNLNMTV